MRVSRAALSEAVAQGGKRSNRPADDAEMHGVGVHSLGRRGWSCASDAQFRAHKNARKQRVPGGLRTPPASGGDWFALRGEIVTASVHADGCVPRPPTLGSAIHTGVLLLVVVDRASVVSDPHFHVGAGR